jgi:hypothetical protein
MIISMVIANATKPKSSGTKRRASKSVLNTDKAFMMARDALTHALPLISRPLILPIDKAHPMGLRAAICHPHRVTHNGRIHACKRFRIEQRALAARRD